MYITPPAAKKKKQGVAFSFSQWKPLNKKQKASLKDDRKYKNNDNDNDNDDVNSEFFFASKKKTITKLLRTVLPRGISLIIACPWKVKKMT